MKKLVPLPRLHKKAWDLQSRFKRQAAADEFGYVFCYTCGVRKPWKEMQWGHYLHGDCMDFVDDNNRVQCPQCNKWKHGNGAVFGIKLQAEIGPERFQLLPMSKQAHKFTREELQEIIDRYEVK